MLGGPVIRKDAEYTRDRPGEFDIVMPVGFRAAADSVLKQRGGQFERGETRLRDVHREDPLRV